MPGGFTRNGSMKWFVNADGKEKETKDGNGKWRLEGKDRTEKDGFFKITIQHPSGAANRVKFLRQLQQHVDRALADDTIERMTVYMPVEDATSGYQVPSPDDPAS